jgi:phosphate transport system substrate-binding protein
LIGIDERGSGRRPLAISLGLLLLAGCGKPASESPTRGHLEVAVAEAHAPIVTRTAELFESLYPEARVHVQAVSTREAFIALLADSVRLVVVDRLADGEEAQACAAAQLDLEKVVIAEDALALLVNAANGLQSVTLDQAAALLAGRTREWSEFGIADLRGPVEIVTTGRNSGSWALLRDFFPNAGVPAPSRIEPTEQAVLQRVAMAPGSLGVVSVAAWRDPAPGVAAPVSQNNEAGWANGVPAPAAGARVRALGVVTVDSLGHTASRALHQANIHRGAYPLHFPVLVYFDKHSLLAAGFSAFLASAPGQKRILDAGLVPATMPVRLVHLH